MFSYLNKSRNVVVHMCLNKFLRKWRSGAKRGDYPIKGGSNEDCSWQKKCRSVLNDRVHLRGELLF